MRYLSLCSGIEAASVAWAPLGWTPVAFAEVAPFPAAVLQARFPEVPNLGDVAGITAERLEELGAIDVVIGGTPCQDLSAAGLRAGLEGDRSSLFYEFARVWREARRVTGARFCVWENVPGAFQTNGGGDFAAVVDTLAGARVVPPPDGWGNEGVALGEHGLLEWAVLDAQWFGVAQRRRRLFVVLDSGDWAHRPPVLLEPESVRGDSPPSRAPGAHPPPPSSGGTRGGGELHAPTIAAPLTHGGHPESNAPGRRKEDDENLVAGPILAHDGKGFRPCAEAAAGVRLIAEDVADPVLVREAKTYTQEGDHNFRLRNVVACFDETQITHPENRSRADPSTAALAESARPPAVASPETVRRLTPRECERLQGFPDDWTSIPFRGRPVADTPRYAALGNSMAVPVVRWIGERLEAVQKIPLRA